MSRLVELKFRIQKPAEEERRPLEFAAPEAPASWEGRLKDYGERVAKYVPAEVLAFYTGAVQLILTKEGPEYRTLRLWLFAIFGLMALLGTPWYLGKFAKHPKEKRVNQIMATVAFAVWGYAYPAGWFTELGWHEPVIGGLLLLLWSFFSGLIQPWAPTNDRGLPPLECSGP